MHIHILGICGTFMGGLALLARAAGHRVTGCDLNVYPPMSTQLLSQGVDLIEGYDAAQVGLAPDRFVVGNAISRGNPLLEEILDRGLPYVSGPQWLSQEILPGKWVLAVAGTHGKTTTSSMLAWILEYAGLAPGFLIGGVPADFGLSARWSESNFFVVEADEYDSAFCDKRSKFIHYRPRTVVLNNLEFDHADIFADLAAIETQFHHLIRTVPRQGLIVANAGESSLRRVIDRGVWTPVEYFGSDEGWNVRFDASAQANVVSLSNAAQGSWVLELPGRHNSLNGLAALLAARHVGVPVAAACAALSCFKGVKRRLELRGEVGGVAVYDDFAHHPTAIAATLAALRSQSPSSRLLAVFEPRSNTMRLGVMKAKLADSLAQADLAFCYGANLGWDAAEALAPMGAKARVFDSVQAIVAAVAKEARQGDRVLVMSNGGFGGIHERLLGALATR